MESVKEAAIVEKTITKTITKRLVSNFGWSIVSEAIGKGVFFITNIYLARTLGVENFGLFTLAQTITFYFWFAVDLGTNMYGIREIAKNKEHAEKIINPLLTLRITSGLVVFFIYVTSLFFFNMPMVNKLTFAGCGIYLLTYSFYTDWILKGFEKFKFIAFGSLVSSSIFLSGTLFLVKGNKDVATASFVWSLSFLLGSMTLFYLLHKKIHIKIRFYFDTRSWFFHLKESIYFMTSSSLFAISQFIPILLLSIFFTKYEVGLFSAVYRVNTTISNAVILIPTAFYPIFSELYMRDKIGFRKTHNQFKNFMIVIGFFVGIIGTFFAEHIVSFLLGNQYMGGINVFKMLCWLIALNFLRFVYGPTLLSIGLQKLHNIATLTSAVTTFILGMILIPKFSILGAAMSLLSSEALLVMMLAVIFYKYR